MCPDYIRSVEFEVAVLWAEVSVDPLPPIAEFRRWAKNRTMNGDKWHDACDFLNFALGDTASL